MENLCSFLHLFPLGISQPCRAPAVCIFDVLFVKLLSMWLPLPPAIQGNQARENEPHLGNGLVQPGEEEVQGRPYCAPWVP